MEKAQAEAAIRYLTTADGGRSTPVASGYRGQFHYEDEREIAHDAFQYFPDVPDGQSVGLGTTVKAALWFFPDRWRDCHSKRVKVGMKFEIREGKMVVGNGVITKLREQDSEPN